MKLPQGAGATLCNRTTSQPSPALDPPPGIARMRSDVGGIRLRDASSSDDSRRQHPRQVMAGGDNGVDKRSAFDVDRYDVRMPRYEPIIPEGQRLGTSHEHDGAVTGHLFDEDNKLQGHAAWKLVDDEPADSYSASYEASSTRPLTPEEEELIEQITVLVLTLIVVGVQAAAPHVQRWWIETALPAMREAWSRVTRRKEPAAVERVEAVELLEVVEAQITNEPQPGNSLALADPVFTMSSAEWAERYRAMLAAGRFRDEQADILRRATIVDEAALTVEADLTPRQFAANVRQMLTSNPKLLTDETAAELRLLLDDQLKKRRGDFGV